jgi:hypothetical protein
VDHLKFDLFILAEKMDDLVLNIIKLKKQIQAQIEKEEAEAEATAVAKVVAKSQNSSNSGQERCREWWSGE